LSETAAKSDGGGEGRSLRAYYALAALVVGLVAGMLGNRLAPAIRGDALGVASFVGTLWLNALKMTVIPLVVALLVVGIAKSAQAAQTGRVAGRAVLWIVIICTVSAMFGAIATLLLTNAFPLPHGAAVQLQRGLAGVDKSVGSLPGPAEFFKGMIPPNLFAAANNGDILPLTIFALLFGLALTRLTAPARKSIVTFFEAIGDAFVVIIEWVLLLAPLGVFALAFTVGSEAGSAAFAALSHYVVVISLIGVIVTLAAYPLAWFVGGLPMASFARGMIAPQAVAISTRSSLASLPAMLTSSRTMGIRDHVADVTLPIAVALFRATGPAMNVAVAFYVAHWLGIQPNLSQMIAATAVGAVMSYGAVSLPGEVSYISSIAPIAIALGVPIAPLGLLVAVEMVPDIFRTVGNVTHDVALAGIVNRSVGSRA
jgi:proton glutamate symport protein